MQNYFELFSLPVDFKIDALALEQAYQQQVSIFHPDKFTTQTRIKQLQALQNTSLLNTAFNTLKLPLERAAYLLSLSNINVFDEKDTQMEVEFLAAQIELRESLELIKSSRDESKLDDFIDTLTKSVNNNIVEITQAFESQALQEVKRLTRELKFFKQLHTQASILTEEFL
jgi:molecular chaperone HscB